MRCQKIVCSESVRANRGYQGCKRIVQIDGNVEGWRKTDANVLISCESDHRIINEIKILRME